MVRLGPRGDHHPGPGVVTEPAERPEPTVRFERTGPDGAVGVIRLNRPPVNALNSGMHADLLAAVREAARTPQVRAVLLTGGERAFAAGADIKEMADLDPDQIAGFGRTLGQAIDELAALDRPVIAAITGYALGAGCEVALAADLRVIAEDARIGLPEITLGVIPGAGGTQRLARLVGVARAKELIFLGRTLTGAEAVRVGLATTAVPAADVAATALELATRLAGGPTRALAAAKLAVDEGSEAPLADGLVLESAQFAALFGTEDQRQGMRSFIERGPGQARFTGR